MLQDDEQGKSNSDHRYPPYYFTHKYFGSKMEIEGGNYEEYDLILNKYSDKSQLVAFLLSFFFGGFGAGRFYCEQYFSAAFKLLLSMIVCCIGCLVSFLGCLSVGSRDQEFTNTHHRSFPAFCKFCYGLIVPLLNIILFAWIITDWVLFGLNEIPDGYGRTLEPW